MENVVNVHLMTALRFKGGGHHTGRFMHYQTESTKINLFRISINSAKLHILGEPRRKEGKPVTKPD